MQAKSCSRLEIDHELESSRKLDRQIAGFGAGHDLRHVGRTLSIGVYRVFAIAEEHASHRVFAVRHDRWKPKFHGEIAHLGMGVRADRGVVVNDEPLHARVGRSLERGAQRAVGFLHLETRS